MENKDWIIGAEGKNLKFKRETLLNYAMNRWGLNKAASVGSTSELIRACAPAAFEDWEAYYFGMASQKRRTDKELQGNISRGLDRPFSSNSPKSFSTNYYPSRKKSV